LHLLNVYLSFKIYFMRSLIEISLKLFRDTNYLSRGGLPSGNIHAHFL